MNTLKKLSTKKILGSGIALFMAVSTAYAYAEEGDMTQTRTQDRTRTELNLQVPSSDFGQSRNREENAVRNQNQYQYQYKNMHQNIESNSGFSSMNRINTTNRFMHGSTATGAMNRQNIANQPMSAGRR